MNHPAFDPARAALLQRFFVLWLALLAVLVSAPANATLPLRRIAPPINGSRRFLLGGSLQPSEFAKVALEIGRAHV